MEGELACIATIDWQAVGSVLQGIGTLGGAGTVLAAAIIGSNTFQSWKRQKLTERQAEQAERILVATYNARRSLSRVRSPMMAGHELSAAETKLKENGEWDKIAGGDRERQRVATIQAYYTRLFSTRDDQRALEECLPMARALFDEELEKALEKLRHQFWTVQVYVDALHRDREGADAEFREKVDRIIYEGYPSEEKNEMDATIAEQVKLIEETCVPALRLEAEATEKALTPRATPTPSAI